MAMSRSFFFCSFILFFTVVPLVRSTKKRPSLIVNGEEHLTADLGEHITLPCSIEMESIQTSRLVVHWTKDGVTKYFRNTTCCNIPGYEISNEDLGNGRAPLKLVNVQERDAGVYTCFVKYDAMEGSWNTKIIINVPPGIPTTQMRTTTVDDSIVPEPMPEHRTLKWGLVSGVVAVTLLLAVLLYCCYEG